MSKQQFFEYMSETFGYEFGCERSYELLKDVIREAKDNPENLKEFVELKDLSKRDSEIYRNYLAEKGIEKTWQVIKKGGIAIFPTDTVYGIGCNPYNINAVKKIYEIKSRTKLKSLNNNIQR